MIYEKKQKIKVVRTEHHLRIYSGTGTASMLKRSLSQVPDAANLTDIIESESNLLTLVFIEEEASPPGDEGISKT